MSRNTIPKKALVALPDMTILPPEEAKISAYDRSFHFGDSLYEAVRTYDGIIFSMDEHMARLRRSAEMAMYEVMPDTDHITKMVREACQAYFEKFGNSDVFVRITVSRGIGDINIDRDVAGDPYAIVFVKEMMKYAPSSYTDGLHYWVVDRRRNLPAALDPQMKTGNYLNNVLALREARLRHADDALMLDYRGFVTEGTTNNVYGVKDGTVWTAPLSVGILAGVTRDWIFELCQREGITIKERLFTAEEAQSCDEFFTSATTKEVMPITKISGRPVSNGRPGPITQRLRAGFHGLVSEYCKKHARDSLFV